MYPNMSRKSLASRLSPAKSAKILAQEALSFLSVSEEVQEDCPEKLPTLPEESRDVTKKDATWVCPHWVFGLQTFWGRPF